MATGLRDVIEQSTDVVVVGGGPAGSSAAIRCALAGQGVTLVEAQPFPRHRPGESLHPGVMVLLRQLGVEPEIENAGFLRYPGQTVAWGNELHFQAFGPPEGKPWLGIQAPRERLDAILLRRAEHVGVTVYHPCRAESAIIENGRVCGIVTSAGTIRATYVVDATGGRHWLGRQLQCGVYRASRRLIAYYGYASATAEATCPQLTADADGWTWQAPLGDGREAWVRLPLHAKPQRPTGLGHVRGADVTWRLLPEAAGPGYFLVGDATAVLDPLAAHGVLRALLSGIQAAYLIDLLHRQRVAEARAIQTYRAWWLELFENDVAALRRLYAQLPAIWQVNLEPPTKELTVD
jgi:flavin-dependent dehydrogenase